MSTYTTLAIESSCDDTSIALVSYTDGYFHEERMLTHTQHMHNRFGGVVPELAYRSHAEHILDLVEQIGGTDLAEEIDCICVTSHPGLPGSLLVGITMAHTLGKLWNKPVIEVNHIMGHVFSVLLGRRLDTSALPFVCLTVSGGHTDIYIVTDRDHPYVETTYTDPTNWIKRQHLGIGEQIEVGPFAVTKLGQTKDDAAGEVFDKVARMLDGPYPGGAWLSELAQQGAPDDEIQFRMPVVHTHPFDMSFSGLKSQVYNLLQKWQREDISLTTQKKQDIAYAFQDTICTGLAQKVVEVVHHADAVLVGLVGGVAANPVLRRQVREMIDSQGSDTVPLITTTKNIYYGDNAAMIGVAGLLEYVHDLAIGGDA